MTRLILVDPVDDEDLVHGLILQTSDFDLKKWKNINTHPIYIVIDHHFLFGYGNRIYSNIFIVITDYLPFVN
jgi:hypothetical protein